MTRVTAGMSDVGEVGWGGVGCQESVFRLMISDVFPIIPVQIRSEIG